MTPIYPLAANIRQIRYRYHSNSGFLCKFNTFASLLGDKWETVSPDNLDFNSLFPMQRCEVVNGRGQTNAPSNMDEGTSIFTFGVLNPYGTALKHGFQIGGRGNRFAIRACGYDVWGSWLYITA